MRTKIVIALLLFLVPAFSLSSGYVYSKINFCVPDCSPAVSVIGPPTGGAGKVPEAPTGDWAAGFKLFLGSVGADPGYWWTIPISLVMMIILLILLIVDWAMVKMLPAPRKRALTRKNFRNQFGAFKKRLKR